MAKETRLDESAHIYQPRDKRSDRQRFKDMNFKERLGYFKDYYLFKCVCILLAVGFLGSLSYTIFGPKVETVLFTAVLNSAINEETAEVLETDMTKRLELDEKKSKVFFDTSFFISDSSQYGPSTSDKLVAYLFAGDVDVMIAPEAEFEQYVTQSYMAKLSDQLPTQLFSTLSDRFFSSTTMDDTNEAAYGIYLNDYQIKDANGNVLLKPVLGIVVNSKHKDNAISLIEYLETHKPSATNE